MALFQLLLVHVVFFSSCFISTSASDAAVWIAKNKCPTHCGNVSIPYPFGIGQGCYVDAWFEVVCTRNDTVPLLNGTGQEVVEISTGGTVTVRNPVTFSNCGGRGGAKEGKQSPNMEDSPFAYSRRNVFTSVACGAVALMNSSDGTVGGCLTICNDITSSYRRSNTRINVIAGNESSCNGIGCCQTALPLNLQAFNVSFVDVDGPAVGNLLYSRQRSSACRYAFVADQRLFLSNATSVSDVRDMADVPAVLEWELYRSAAEVFGEAVETDTPGSAKFEYYFDNVTSRTVWYTNSSCKVLNATVSSLSFWTRLECSCPEGFGGNPYLLNGCRDIDECMMPNPHTGGLMCGGSSYCVNYAGYYMCYQRPKTRDNTMFIIGICSGFGALFLIGGAIWWSYKIIKKKRTNQRKQKFFRRNGGLLLQQQLSSGEVNVDKIKLFSSKELEKATDRFNKTRILGQGGQGTVYKGMLADGKIVAVKKSKMMDGDKVNEFINEVVILSQISHRNVVKLLGCCLEIEVPLLVYEFIPNGTLSQYIHDECEELPLTWEIRLRIATETAGALAYLHSSASVPIYHRDIKSANILLDEKYRAKIADFGTSRSVAIDQTHLTTMVYGTFGYLDPEYFQSSQFTDKSDVYSFGVVLVELLSGQKPVSNTRSEKGGSLATCFMVSMEENRVLDIVDERVMKEGERETIMAVAILAKRCLNLNGKRRPTMKEVASALEDIRKSAKSCNGQQNLEVDGCVRVRDRELVAESWDLVSTSTWSCSYDGNGSSSGGVPLLSSTSQ